MKNIFKIQSQSCLASSGLFFVRLVVGLAFMHHGWGKMQSPFHWMGAESPVPAFLQFLAALSEFGGGLAWVLGLVTPLASFGIACTMLVALQFHIFMRHDPFVAATGGPAYEIAMVYLSVAVLMFTAGPGKLSLDRKIFGVRGDCCPEKTE
jgi:putative oxidoreductase